MNTLTLTEQRHGRTALRHLRARLGSWKAAGAALGFAAGTLDKAARGEIPVTVQMVFSLARHLDASIDGLLAGEAVPSGTCPHCGRTPDFADEGTAVSPTPTDGLKLVK